MEEWGGGGSFGVRLLTISSVKPCDTAVRARHHVQWISAGGARGL